MLVLNSLPHAYCFSCVVKAAEVSGNRCPMCKTSFRKVIHNVRANDDYDTVRCCISKVPKKKKMRPDF